MFVENNPHARAFCGGVPAAELPAIFVALQYEVSVPVQKQFEFGLEPSKLESLQLES